MKNSKVLIAAIFMLISMKVQAAQNSIVCTGYTRLIFNLPDLPTESKAQTGQSIQSGQSGHSAESSQTPDAPELLAESLYLDNSQALRQRIRPLNFEIRQDGVYVDFVSINSCRVSLVMKSTGKKKIEGWLSCEYEDPHLLTCSRLNRRVEGVK